MTPCKDGDLIGTAIASCFAGAEARHAEWDIYCIHMYISKNAKKTKMRYERLATWGYGHNSVKRRAINVQTRAVAMRSLQLSSIPVSSASLAIPASIISPCIASQYPV